MKTRIHPTRPQLLPVLKVEVQGEIHAPRLPIVSVIRRAMGISSPPVSPTDTAPSFKVVKYEHLVIEVSKDKKICQCKEVCSPKPDDDSDAKTASGKTDSSSSSQPVKTFSREELLGLRTSEKVLSGNWEIYACVYYVGRVCRCICAGMVRMGMIRMGTYMVCARTLTRTHL